MKIALVVNPVSGGIDKDPFIKEARSICYKYNIDFELYYTKVNDEEELKKFITKSSPNRVAVIGGDGSILICAKILMGSGIPMGIIPMGSSNGMAAELAIKTDPIEAFLDVLLTQYTLDLDMVVVNGKYYSIHIGDVGINARIVKAYQKDGKRGIATYVKYFLEELSKPEKIEFELEINGEHIKSEALMIAICNSRRYGTGFALNNTGSPCDGKFEIVLIEDIDLNNLILAGLSSLDEKLVDSDHGRTISATEALIKFREKQLLQLDGEIIGEFTSLKAEIIPGAVKLLLNKNRC